MNQLNYNSANSSGPSLQGGQLQPRFLTSVNSQSSLQQPYATNQRPAAFPNSKDQSISSNPKLKASIQTTDQSTFSEHFKLPNQFKTQDNNLELEQPPNKRFTFHENISLGLKNDHLQISESPSQQYKAQNASQFTQHEQISWRNGAAQDQKGVEFGDEMRRAQNNNGRQNEGTHETQATKTPIDFVKHRYKQDPAAQPQISKVTSRSGLESREQQEESFKIGEDQFKKIGSFHPSQSSALTSIQKFVIDEDFLDNLGLDTVEQESAALTSPIMISPEFKESLEIDVQVRKILPTTSSSNPQERNQNLVISENHLHQQLDSKYINTNQVPPPIDLHRRMHSDYSNTPIEMAALVGAGASSTRDQVLTKKIIEQLETGLSLMNSDRVEEALKEFKVAETIFNQSKSQSTSQNHLDSTQVISPLNNSNKIALMSSSRTLNEGSVSSGLDDNYLAVLKYNISCCYQRLGMIDLCIKSLQEAIESLDSKIKSIKDKTNFSFTERSISQAQLSINSQAQETQDQEMILGNLLHKYRYQCKFHLQVCAVLSQLNKHEEAYVFGDKAAAYAVLLMNKAYELCQLFVLEINKKREQQAMRSKQRRSSAVSGTHSIDEDEGMGNLSPYGAKNQSANQISNNISQQSLQQRSIQSQATHLPNQVQVNNYFASSIRNNSVCNRSSESQNSATRVNIRRASSADGSLERIHTFNLKLQKLQNQKQGAVATSTIQLTNLNGKEDKGEEGRESNNKNDKDVNLSNLNLNGMQTQNSRNEKDQFNKKHFHTTTSVTSNTSNNPAHKAYYVEEKTKVLENIIIKVQPTINEFQRIISEFQPICKSKERERQQLYPQTNKRERQKHAALKISFHDDTEINLLKFNHKFKQNVRNILGIKHQDDWIFNLNIGNVMHLTPMNTDELAAKLDKTHELNKDAMLEKIILFVVSFFCVGTELRFLSQKEEADVSKKDSEMWHAKSMHTACLFLPEDCPLVNHIINSYKKHHLNPKLEMLRLRKLEEEQSKRRREIEEQALLSSKEQSIGIGGGYSTIQGTSKQSTDGNNSRSIGDDHEAMKEIKQQIENFLQKSKKSSTAGAAQGKVSVLKLSTGQQLTLNGQQTARPSVNGNIILLGKQDKDEGALLDSEKRRKSQQTSRNQLRHGNTVQNQILVTTNSLKNLGTNQQIISKNPQANGNSNTIFQTIQGGNTLNRGNNQSPSNITNDSHASSSIDQKVAAFLNSKRLTTNFSEKSLHANNLQLNSELQQQQQQYQQQQYLKSVANRSNQQQQPRPFNQNEQPFIYKVETNPLTRRVTSGSSPENMSLSYNIKQLPSNSNLPQSNQAQGYFTRQQTSVLGSQNSSIVNNQGVKSRPISPRNVMLMGLQNLNQGASVNDQPSRNHQIGSNCSQIGQSTTSRQSNKSPTNFVSTNVNSNQNLQKISSQIIEQILKKTSPLENALKPSGQMAHTQQLNGIVGLGQSPTNISIAGQGGAFGPGAKKIFVFPNKKKFPLAATQLGSHQQTLLIGEQKSPKTQMIEKKLKMSKVSQSSTSSLHQTQTHHQKSQRQLQTQSQSSHQHNNSKQQSSQQRGNTPVTHNQKAKSLVGAGQIQMHYQNAQKTFRQQSRSPTNFESENESQVVGLTKYKSLEQLPVGDILSQMTRQQTGNNPKKVKLKLQRSGHSSNIGSGERPNSSKSQRQHLLKNQILTNLQSSSNSTQILQIQQPYTQRLGSPVNYGLGPLPSHYPMLGTNASNSQAATVNTTSIQQAQPPVLNYNFSNINFINNVNIFEENKQQQSQNQGQSLQNGNQGNNNQQMYMRHSQNSNSTPQQLNFYPVAPSELLTHQNMPTSPSSHHQTINLLNEIASPSSSNNYNRQNEKFHEDTHYSQGAVGFKKNSMPNAAAGGNIAVSNRMAGPRKSQTSQISKYLK